MKNINKPAFALLTTLLSTPLLAQSLDSGSLAREAEQQAVQVSQKIAEIPPLAESRDESDPTPLAVKRIQFEGNQLFDQTALDKVVAEFGEIQTLGQLRAVMNRVTAFYQAQGYPLVLLSLPPQKVPDGVVRVQVLESKVSRLALENQSRLRENVVQGYLQKIPQNQPLYQPTSERALLLMKDLAGTDYVGYRLAKGEQVGESILGVELQPAKLISGNVMSDNHGSKTTGEWRTRASLNLNSLFGRGERVALQAMSSFKGLNYGRVGLELPLGYDGLSLSSNYAHTRYELGGAFRNLNAEGTADSVDVGLRYPLLRTNSKNLWLSAGGEHRKLKDEVNSTHTDTRKRLISGNFALNGNIDGANGSTQFGLTNTFGRLAIQSADARELDARSAKTQGGYYKLNLNASRTQFLSEQWTAIASLNAQWANKNLDSAEQMSLGGAEAISAYHSGDLSVDRGLTGQLELRYALNNLVSFSGFYDVGAGKVRAKPYIQEKNHFVLQGAGVGVNINYKGFFLQSKVAYAINNPLKERNLRTPRVWLKLGYSF